jgi:hypothetical protein
VRDKLRSSQNETREQKKSFEERIEKMEQQQQQQRLVYQKELSEANDLRRASVREAKESGDRTLQTMEELYKDTISELRT